MVFDVINKVRISRLWVFCKRMFSEILQNSQENTCARDSFLKNSLWHRCFPVNFMKFLRAPFWQNSSGLLLMLRDYFTLGNKFADYFKLFQTNYRINRWVNYCEIWLSTIGSFFPVVYCSERNVSFVYWRLTFPSFQIREEKI